MRAINYYTEQPQECEIIPIGDGRRAWVFYREDIAKHVETDEGGNEREVWSATEYSTQVNALGFKISEAFVDRLKADESAAEAKRVRAKRNALLEATDKEMLADRANSKSAHYKAVAAYRQKLRDIPEQTGFPFDVEWPELEDGE